MIEIIEAEERIGKMFLALADVSPTFNDDYDTEDLAPWPLAYLTKGEVEGTATLYERFNGTVVLRIDSDVITVTADEQVLTKNVGSNISYRKSIKIAVTTQSGLTPEVISATPDCTYAAGVFTALKGSGVCALSVSTPGNATTAPTSANYPFFVGLGEQSIATFATSVKAGKRITLPVETTFGEKITYRTSSKNCQVSKGVLKGIKKGSCVVTATAAGKVDLWKPMVRNISIPVK